MSSTQKIYAAESTRWYDSDGNPVNEMPLAKPKEDRTHRATTLRDARKFQFAPSVTTINGVPNKPALNAWQRNQVLMASLTLPRIEGESLDQFALRAAQDADAHVQEASERGTAIHAAVCRALAKEEAPEDREFHAEITNTLQVLDDILDSSQDKWNLRQETPFTHPYGYGGKVDLWLPGVVIDLKTKDFDPDVNVERKLAWDEQCMQLAAYAYGLGIGGGNGPGGTWPRLINVYISRSNPGVVRWHEWTPEDADRAWSKFKLLLRYWQLDKNYVPDWAEEVPL